MTTPRFLRSVLVFALLPSVGCVEVECVGLVGLDTCDEGSILTPDDSAPGDDSPLGDDSAEESPPLEFADCQKAEVEALRFPEEPCPLTLTEGFEGELVGYADVTGDGSDDIVYYAPAGRCVYVSPWTGSGIGAAVLWLDLDDRWPTRRWLAEVASPEGDPTPRKDLVWMESCDEEARWYVGTSTGNAFVEAGSEPWAESLGFVDEVYIDELSGADTPTMIRWCDYTGDGVEDVLVYRRTPPEGVARFTVGVTKPTLSAIDWQAWRGPATNGTTADLLYVGNYNPGGRSAATCDVLLYKDDDGDDGGSDGSDGRWFEYLSTGDDFSYNGSTAQVLFSAPGTAIEQGFIRDIDGDGVGDVVILRDDSWLGEPVWLIAYSRMDEVDGEGEQRHTFYAPVLWPQSAPLVTTPEVPRTLFAPLRVNDEAMGSAHYHRAAQLLVSAPSTRSPFYQLAPTWLVAPPDPVRPPEGCAIPFVDPEDPTHHWYFCQDDPTPDDGYGPEGSHPRTWEEAKAYCEAQGDRLVEFDDAAEQYLVAQNVIVNPTDRDRCSSNGCDAWIGVRRAAGTGGPWTFASSGAEATFQDWHSAEPNSSDPPEDCVEVRYDSADATPGDQGEEAGFLSWNNLSCAETRPFICEHGS